MIVTALNRYAVKGLSGDALTHVELLTAGETFPDDRRFALLQRKHLDEFRRGSVQHDDGVDGSQTLPWLHKEKFLCAFTDPELLARLRTTYSIQTWGGDGRSSSSSSSILRLSRGYPNDAAAPVVDADAEAVGRSVSSLQTPNTLTATATGTAARVRRVLTVRDRSSGLMLLPELDLNRVEDRVRLQVFMSAYSGRDVVCVMANDDDDNTDDDNSNSSTHQFGNTSSGYKQRGDTRTVHIVTQQTVDALSRAVQADADAAASSSASLRSSPPSIPIARIRPNRFRPNIVVDGGPNFEPFEEFQWIGKRIKVVKSAAHGRIVGSTSEPSGLLELSVIAKTVRCRGVSVDPDDDEGNRNSLLDVPDLLVRHFPQHGPYSGVYAVVERPGILSLGDELSVLPPLN